MFRSRISSLLTFLAISFHAGSWATCAWASWPTTLNADVPVCTSPGDQINPATISDGAGGVIIVWRTGTGVGGFLHAQRVDVAGTPLWTPNGVPLNTTLLAGSVSVATDGAGGAIVAWDDPTLGSGSYQIRAQRVDATGVTLWGTDGVAVCTAPNDQRAPQVVSDGAGGAILSWADNRASGNPFVLLNDIYAQRVDAAGTSQWAANGVALCTAAGEQTNVLISADGAGGAIVGWLDQRAGAVDVYAQRVDPTGAPQWAANGVAVASAAAQELPYASVPDGAGGAVFLYQGIVFGNQDIYAQRLDSAGNLVWSAGGVPVCTATGNQQGPTIAPDGTGGAILAWLDNRSGIATEVYAQRVDGAGAPQWTTDGVAIRVGLPGRPTFFVKIIPDGAGGAVLSWPDSRLQPVSDLFDLFAQRISSTGSTAWGTDGVAVCTAVNNQGGQSMIPDGVGGAILAWGDRRSGNSDIYAQRVAPNGLLGGSAAETFGNVGGSVTATCPSVATPLYGVTVDAFAVGSGTLLGSAVTDAAGNYSIDLLPVGDYTITIVTPLGYTVPNDVLVTISDGQTTAADFTLSCAPASGNPSSSGFWKHQFGVATGGNGNAAIDATSLCGYLDLIEAHFNNNALNQVVVFDPPDGATCSEKLELGRSLLNTAGSPAPIDKARQHLLSLLLNVASNKLSLSDVISKDDATTSQAITYCDGLIDDMQGDHGLAAAIAEKVNSGQKVNAGVIPLSTEQIAYRGALALRTFRVTPNPGPGPRRFQFSAGMTGQVRLRVFDVSGRLVARLMDRSLAAGPHSIVWDGETGVGSQSGSAVYFARLDTAVGSKTIKVIQLTQ